MYRRLRSRPAAALAALALSVGAAGMALVLEPVAPVEAEAPPVPAGKAPTSAYLQPAKDGVARSRAWWDGRSRWYRERLGAGGRYPLATLWGVVHLFEARNALAIADPSPAHRAAVRAFAAGAERYWNPNLRPVPGYGPYPGNRGARDRAFFDDNGWWGIAFYDAYRATGDARYLASAKRALVFIDSSGWDRRRGGIWWDTRHSFHAGESLAAGTLLAAYLYRETRSPKYLAMATKYIGWADADFRGDDGLYDRHERDATPMPYVQGPMSAAFALLCQSTRDQAYCREAEELADRASTRFPKLTMGPQYDAMYVRSLLELYRFDRNPRWYLRAAEAVDGAMAGARAVNGLYLLTWGGLATQTIGTAPDMLQTHAATTSVIAWMAAADPPSSP
jgi:uncharacterized protein YyaL (SSP411 family)